MEKTSMTGSVAGKFPGVKRKLHPFQDAPFAAIESQAMRDSQNPVKVRAAARARTLGKSLGAVYVAAGVNKAYLSEVPKSGWRENKLRAIAKELNWTIDDLMEGPAEGRTNFTTNYDNLLQMAIDVSNSLVQIASHDDRPSTIGVGELSVLLYNILRAHSADGLAIPDDRSLGIIARFLFAALSNRSSSPS
jgi:hypothetical protein